MKTRLAAISLLASLLLAAPPIASARQDGGHLDRSFGRNGKTILGRAQLGAAINGGYPFGEGADGSDPEGASRGGIATKLLPLGGGRFLLASGNRLFSFEASGRLNRGFGNGGVVEISAPAGESLTPTGVTIDSDGRILVAGEAWTLSEKVDPTPGPNGHNYPEGTPPIRAVVLRLLPNGEPDPSFGAGGLVESTFGLPTPSYEGFPYPQPIVRGFAVATDSSDRPIVTGSFATEATLCYPFVSLFFRTRGFVARLSSSGALESLSGDPTVAGSRYGATLTHAPGRRILFEGWRGAECVRGDGPGTHAVAVTMLGPGGSTKAGFEASNLTFNEIPQTTVDGEGRVVLSADEPGEVFGPAAVVRLRPNGSLDPGFGDGGRVELPEMRAGARSVAADDRNRLYLGSGLIDSYEIERGSKRAAGFSLTRLTVRGEIDRRFGKRGTVRIPFSSAQNAQATAVMVNGKGQVLVAGPIVAPGELGPGAIGIARYVPANR